MSLASYTNVETILESLKTYIRNELRDSKNLVRTVKAGLIDERDELPMIMVLPVLETIDIGFNGNLSLVSRQFRIDIVDKAFHVEDVRESLKRRIAALSTLFSIQHLNWNLSNSEGKIQNFDFELGRETLGEPTGEGNIYSQFATLPLTLRGYIQIDNPIIPSDVIECSLLELLDYLMMNAKNEFQGFDTFWRDIIKPTSLENFPALGIFIQEPNEDKNTRTSTNFEDITLIYRVYSSLATREIAFTNHLRNVEKIKEWIFERPALDGRVDYFKINSIDYGIDLFKRPFQGGEQEYPVFRSDITCTCSLLEFKYS